MTLDSIGGPGGAWLIAALVLGIAELAAPGIFLVFLAIAAGITGVTLFALPALPLVVQLVSFAAWSAVAVLVGKRWYADYPVPSSDAKLNDRVARMIGEVVTVEVAIDGGHGRVRVGDGSWPATGTDAPVGTRMRIVAVSDGVPVVEPVAGPATGIATG